MQPQQSPHQITLTSHTETQHWHFSQHVPTGTSEPIITCLRAVLQIQLEVVFECLWVSHCSLDSRVLLHGLHPALELWGVIQRATGKRKGLSNANGKSGGHQGNKTAQTVPFYYFLCPSTMSSLEQDASPKLQHNTNFLQQPPRVAHCCSVHKEYWCWGTSEHTRSQARYSLFQLEWFQTFKPWPDHVVNHWDWVPTIKHRVAFGQSLWRVRDVSCPQRKSTAEHYTKAPLPTGRQVHYRDQWANEGDTVYFSCACSISRVGASQYS